MRRTLADAILKAYAEQRDDLPDGDLDDEQPVTLTVTFRLGDLRGLRRTIASIDQFTKTTDKA